MNNLNKIKFKESITGWLFKIDDSGKTEFKIGTRFVDELQAWKDLGNKIGPQYTPKEQVEEDKKEADIAAIAWIGDREAEYPSIKELTVALWEKIVENRPEMAAALELKRQATKKKVKKPL